MSIYAIGASFLRPVRMDKEVQNKAILVAEAEWQDNRMSSKHETATSYVVRAR